ncbi:MAG: DUF1127 domain-containing protein [Candidatus Sedimenticola sp. 20ELBAFRAG]
MNTQTLTLNKALSSRQVRPLVNLANTLRILFSRARFVWQRQRQRRRLLELDDRLLKDIGISRVDAMGEGGKPFWRD